MAADNVDPPQLAFSPHGGLGVKTQDNRFAIGLHGFMQLDGAVFDDDQAQLGNGTSVRNAKLIVKGKAFTDWGYKFQVDFTNDGKKKLQDLFVQYRGFKPVTVKLGNFKQPFSLQFLNGARKATFMELGLMHEALVPKRRVGIQAASHSPFYTAQAGVFTNKVTDNPDQDTGVGVVARGVLTPIHTKQRLVMLGLAGQYRHLGDFNKVAMKARPDSHVTAQRMVGFGPHTQGNAGSSLKPITDGQNIAAGDVQATAAFGPWAAQGEYVHKRVERRDSSFDADGGYVQASYFLTGDSRASAYKSGAGAYGRIVPKHDYGAWQVAFRYDALNLNDGGIAGGREHDYTAALNWYVNKAVRFDLNYVRASADYPNGPDNDSNIYQVRAQVGF
ncbi:hypothetical protein HKX42_09110 [Salinisphaera sp. USBA-960]|nr:hypothetical protein [Salifodinibacter halophilus]NNC27033.1 hypothetical protein [Salifodinibacter halophilus]